MKEKAKAHNAPHDERFDLPSEESPGNRPSGTGWIDERKPAPPPHKPDQPEQPPDE